MGLDMYLDVVPKIPGMTLQQIEDVSCRIEEIERLHQDAQKSPVPVKIDLYESIKDHIVTRGSGAFRYSSLFKELGYWRKANAIHGWFVKNVQNGYDECEAHIVHEEQLKSLLNTCRLVMRLRNDSTSATHLPTQGGFFFGDTSFDDYYYESVEYTARLIQSVLDTVDFSTHDVVYRSSW